MPEGEGPDFTKTVCSGQKSTETGNILSALMCLHITTYLTWIYEISVKSVVFAQGWRFYFWAGPPFRAEGSGESRAGG